MRRRFRVHRGMWIAVAALACGSGEIVRGVTDSTFVATLADLQRIRTDPTLDSAERDDARRRVLQGRGLTAEQMNEAARALAEDPRRARELLQAVRVKLMPGADSADADRAGAGRAGSGRTSARAARDSAARDSAARDSAARGALPPDSASPSPRPPSP